jgi:hypothetical protein
MRIQREQTTILKEEPITSVDHLDTITEENVEEKRDLFRFNQVVWYALELITILLFFRIGLMAIGANPAADFSSFIYAVTAALVAPFMGIVPTSIYGDLVIDWTSLVAIFGYFLFALIINYILERGRALWR